MGNKRQTDEGVLLNDSMYVQIHGFYSGCMRSELTVSTVTYKCAVK